MNDAQDSDSRSRGRPSRSATQIEDKRAQIAACALRLFQQDGYEAVSMRKLAAEAGCTTRTLYAYFDAKIDILRLLWSEVFDQLFTRLDAIAAAQPDPERRLEQVARAYTAYWLENRDTYFMVFMSAGLSRGEVSDYVETQGPAARFALFATCLAQARPGLGPDQIKLRSEALLCALNGITQAHITLSGHDWTAPDALVRMAVQGVLAKG